MKKKKTISPLKERNEEALQDKKTPRSRPATNGRKPIAPPPFSRQTPFVINKMSDIRKASKVLMTDLVNKEGRFTVAEARVFKDMAELYFKAEENITAKRVMNQLRRENKKLRGEQ